MVNFQPKVSPNSIPLIVGSDDPWLQLPAWYENLRDVSVSEHQEILSLARDNQSHLGPIVALSNDGQYLETQVDDG
jgi:hypothetical protein